MQNKCKGLQIHSTIYIYIFNVGVDTLPQPPYKQILYSLVSEISKTGEGGGEVLFSPDPGMARTSSPEQDPGARLSTNLRKISNCPEKIPTRVFSLLKPPTSSFTVNNLVRQSDLKVDTLCKDHKGRTVWLA